MLGILLIFVLCAVSLSLFFWVGSVFLQGYIYTEPSEKLHWQAPAAGLTLAAFLTLWCLLVAATPGAGPGNIPYDSLFTFSPKIDLVKEPVPELILVNNNDKKVRYKRQRIDQTRYRYVEDSLRRRPWDRYAKSIEIQYEGKSYVFKPIPRDEGSGREFVCDDGGWVLTEYEGGTNGIPTRFLMTRFLANILLNFFHFALWLACLWLVLRYSLGHSLGLAFVLWLATTLVLLPMLLDQAAQIAQARG